MRRALILSVLLLSPAIRADEGLRLDWTRESLTATWRHYTQIVGGLEVEGAGVIERADRAGSVREVYRELVTSELRRPRPVMATSDAMRALPAGRLGRQT